MNGGAIQKFSSILRNILKSINYYFDFCAGSVRFKIVSNEFKSVLERLITELSTETVGNFHGFLLVAKKKELKYTS
ncbi:MAG: hypothetical protein P4M14_12045 [Gammaproteobacteria bacterium]|nr:hypothetical protein [Gammaproteobacteria bacterium]